MDTIHHIQLLQSRCVIVHHDPLGVAPPDEDSDGVSDIKEQGPDGVDPDYDRNGDGTPDS